MNDLKLMTFNGANTAFGLSAPCDNFTKTIEITDTKFNPLPNVHLTWGSNSGAITNAEGIATISVPDCNTLVTISHVGKRTHQAKYKDLGSLITLQDAVDNLPPIVVGGGSSKPKPQQAGGGKTLVLGLGLLALLALLFTGKEDKKKGLNAPAKTKKTKKKTKKKGLKEPIIKENPPVPVDDIVTIEI